jgi:hypothetical protein
MLRLPFLLLLLTLTSAAATSTLLDVTIDRLVAAPEGFNGKRVSVSGYFDTTVHHGCDLRARRKRSYDPKQYINVVVPDSALPAVKRLTHDFTRVVRAHIVGTFQYRYVGPIKETPVNGDPHVQKIRTIQTGFGWMGLWDKQIKEVTDFRILAQ